MIKFEIDIQLSLQELITQIGWAAVATLWICVNDPTEKPDEKKWLSPVA